MKYKGRELIKFYEYNVIADREQLESFLKRDLSWLEQLFSHEDLKSTLRGLSEDIVMLPWLRLAQNFEFIFLLQFKEFKT
jgi:hypothetical protein